MAQTGFTPILIYGSTTASAAPSASNLTTTTDGVELAINATDGKLYYKDNGGTVQLLASKAGAAGDVVGPASATDSAVALFNGTTGKLIKDSAKTLPTGVIVGTTDSQTLTNKSLTSPALTGTATVVNMTATGYAAMEIDTLTDGATITPDFSVGNNFSVTLAGNRTLANPTNLVAGQSGVIFISQDATGSRTLAYGSYWDFPNATAPTLTTTANAVDMLVFTVRNSTSIGAVLISNIG